MKLLMTADAVGGVWQYATELAAALVPHGVETVIAVLGPAAEHATSSRHPGDPSPPHAGDSNGIEETARTSWVSIGSNVPRTFQDRLGDDPTQCSSAGMTNVGPFGVVNTNLPLDWLAPGPEPVRAAAEALRDLVRDNGADLVHLNSPALAAGGGYSVPVIAAAHGCVATWWDAAHGSPLPAAFAWHEAMMRDGLAAADAVVAPSRSYAETIARRYGLGRTPHAIHNGRTPLPLPDVAPTARAFTAGRLWDRVKNTALLDRVAARVPIRAAGPVTGPHGEGVAVEHLHLLGTLDAAGLARELAGRPVFVSAASFEPFGLAVLEAAQAGCPLVLTDIDTFRELWSDAAIFARGEEEFADAIVALLADPTRHAAMGERARERAAAYTPAATAAAMAALYASLLPAERAAA